MSQYLTLDFAIVAIYLLVTLAVGIYYGRGITTMRQYVIGDHKRYSLFVLVATLFATIVGGGTLGDAERVFSVGIIWAFALLGLAVRWFFIARYIAPHVGRFRKKISIGEMMDDFYGKPGCVITGIAGIIKCVGVLGAQISAIGYLFHHFLGVSYLGGTLCANVIIVVYSSFGGIRSVTATDIVQFGTLIIVIPLVACKALWHAGWYTAVYANTPVGHFDVLSRDDLWRYVFVFILMAVPILDPANIQRLLMARDAEQAHDSFKIASVLHLLHILFVALIGLAVLSMTSNLNPQLALPYAIDTVLSTGFKGLGIAGLFALIMSSADSYLHAASVLLVHDVVQPLRKQTLSDGQELKLVRFVTLLLGVGSIVTALSFESIIDMILASSILWAPIVPAPLFAGIVGYRSSVRSFIIASVFGILAMAAWKTLGIAEAFAIDLAVPGLLANLIAFTLARTFDKPEELHFGQDELKDPRWQKHVEHLRQQQAVARKAGFAIPALSLTWWGKQMACWSYALWTTLLRWLPTPSKVTAFCVWIGKRYSIPYNRICLLTLGSLMSYFWLGFGGELAETVLGIQALGCALSVLVMLRQHFTWRWLHNNVDVLLWTLYLLAWPLAATWGFVTSDKPIGWLMMLLGGLAVSIQTMNAGSALRMWGTGVALGGLTWLGFTGGSLSPQLTGLFVGHLNPALLGYGDAFVGWSALLMDLLLQVSCGGVVIAVVTAALSGSREQQAHLHVQSLLLERAKVGHDINNHLAKAQLYGVDIRDDLAKVQHPQLQETQGLCKSLLRSLRDGLTFLEELMGQVKDPLSHVPKMEIFYMSNCVSDAMNQACRTPEEESRIQWDVMQFIYLVQGNKTRVTYGLANFIRNALDHTKPGDKVMINTEKEDPMHRVSIMDTGEGVVPREVPLIFKAGHTRREGGHGFGLSGAKEGVVSSGGYAYAESVFGYGACFVVEILQATPQQAAAYKAARERKHQDCD